MRNLLAIVALTGFSISARAYVEAPMPLSAVIHQSTNVCTMVVTKVDKQKNMIVYRKVADIKGKHPQEEIKHNIGFGGLRPGEWQEIMNWAEVGKQAVFFHNGGASETFIGVTWYQAYPQGEWWGMSHGEPFLLRSYSGKVEKLGSVVAELLAGKEVIVPCMVDGDKEAIHKKTARVQRVKCLLTRQDYDPKRDFAGWGGEDVRRLAGMPGFDRFAAVGGLGTDALAVSCPDFDGDGKPDVCLVGANRVLLLQNAGDGFSEVSLPGFAGGARAASWADHDGDGLPDLLLATAAGPRLFTNLGKGQFRDDTKRLSVEPGYNPTGIAWLDFDGDGHPDILLANGFHGLRLYRNPHKPNAAAPPPPPTAGEWFAVGPFRHKDGPEKNAAIAFGPETGPFDANKEYKGKRDTSVKWTKLDATDGKPSSLGTFGQNCSIYLHREISTNVAQPWTVSFAGGKAQTIWLNDEKVHSATDAKADPLPLTFNLKAGKNRLVMKLTHFDGESALTFLAGGAAGSALKFEDVSAAWGLGDGVPKAEALTVADFTGDGRPDILTGGTLYVNRDTRFEKVDSGLPMVVGKVGPAAADFDGDGHLDLFVPGPTGCKLYRNDGKGTFADVWTTSGDLAQLTGHVVGATWADFDGDGLPDLFACVLRGPNRYYRNAGGGRFEDRTAEIGLHQRAFNSQAAATADLNSDGKLDLVLANEGQESAVLFGAVAGKFAAMTVPYASANARVIVSANGKLVASQAAVGADGRGGQGSLVARFALPPGEYSVQVSGPRGYTKSLTLTEQPLTVRP